MENVISITLYMIVSLASVQLFNVCSIRLYFDCWAFKRRPLWHSPMSENEQDKPVPQVTPHLYLLSLQTGKSRPVWLS